MMRKLTPDKKPLVKTIKNLVLILFLLFAFLFSGVLPLQNDHSLSSLITSVSASRDFSSFAPRAFRSDSDQTHLLFLHDTQKYDFGDRSFYHSYELEDQSWTLPVKLDDLAFSDMYSMTNLMVHQNETREDAFDVYYSKGNEVFRMTYDGQSHLWSEARKLFNKSDILDYLHFQTSLDHDVLEFWIHSLFYLGKGTFNVVWYFDNRNPSLFSHEYVGHYLVSTVFPNGTIQSQVIPSTGSERNLYIRYLGLNFVPWNTSLMIYSPLFTYRSMLTPNGSWSAWEHSGLYAKKDFQLIDNRYLLNSHKDDQQNYYWTLTDLTASNLSEYPIHLPHKLDPRDTSNRAAFRLQEGHGRATFLTAFVTNSSIELWTYDLLNDTWSLINQLAYSQTNIINFYAESKAFSIDLLADGPSWRVFWTQRVKTGSFLHEIFTVSYHTDTGMWSQVTQVTNTKTITDDYTNGIVNVPGFPLVILFLSFLITIVLRRRKRGCP